MERLKLIQGIIHLVLAAAFLAGCQAVPPTQPSLAPSNSPLPPQPTSTHAKTPTFTARPPTCLDRGIFGDPQESPYILPYPVGKRYKVSQVYCQWASSHSSQLSYDFDLALGDDVIAARSGTVAETVDHFADDGTASGPQEYNYILIRHEDGTVAFYAHLMQDSVLVEVGDAIEAGQAIARVGFSGMPPNVPPCLHFGVYAAWPPVEGEDVAVNFRNAEGGLDTRGGLSLGSWYEAMPWTP